MKFYPTKTIIIPKFSSKHIKTNLDFSNPIQLCNVFIKQESSTSLPHQIQIKSGFLPHNFIGVLKVKCINNNSFDICIGPDSELGHVIFLPYLNC